MDKTGKKERDPDESESPDPNTGKSTNSNQHTAGGYGGQEETPPPRSVGGALESIRGKVGDSRIQLPRAGTSDSQFSKELSKHIPKEALYFRNGELVEISETGNEF